MNRLALVQTLSMVGACTITPERPADAGELDAAAIDANMAATDVPSPIVLESGPSGEDARAPSPDARVSMDAGVFDVPQPARDTLLLATSISVGTSAACAVTPEQTVFCWGALDGTSMLAGKARVIPGLSMATSTSVGDTHACAAAQGVRCWGKPGAALNDTKLGAAGSASPVLSLANGTDVGAGSNASCGLSGANASCWGAVTLGKTNIVQIDLGGTRVCGASSDQQLFCWDGAASAVRDLGGNHGSVSCGVNHCCVSVRDGTTECWGDNTFGQIGRDTAGASVAAPTEVPNLRAVVQVSAGLTHSCGLRGVGEVWCWGESFGAAPVRITLPVAAQVEAGAHSTCALLADQSILCWLLGSKPAYVELAK